MSSILPSVPFGINYDSRFKLYASLGFSLFFGGISLICALCWFDLNDKQLLFPVWWSVRNTWSLSSRVLGTISVFFILFGLYFIWRAASESQKSNKLKNKLENLVSDMQQSIISLERSVGLLTSHLETINREMGITKAINESDLSTPVEISGLAAVTLSMRDNIVKLKDEIKNLSETLSLIDELK